MSTSWGPEKTINVMGVNVRYSCGVELTYSPTTITGSTTSVTVTARLHLRSSVSSNGANADWSMSGRISASGGGVSWNVGSPGGSTVIATRTQSVSLIYGKTQSFSQSGTIKPFASSGTSVSESHSITIPARPVQSPNPVSGVSVERLSDGRIDVTWSNNPTSTRPYEEIEVARWDNATGALSGIATLDGTRTGFADTSTRDNRIYAYQVRPRNAAGAGTFSAPVEVRTTPSTPGAVQVSRAPGGQVRVPRPAVISEAATHWQIQHIQDGTEPGSLAATLPVSTMEWLHTPDPLRTHSYRTRAQAQNPAPSGDPASDWSALSNTVQLIVAPLAPSDLAPTVADADETTLFSWRHNAVDTTPQRAYTFRHRPAGSTGAWTTVPKTSSTTQARTFAAGTFLNGDAIEWQASTWGEAATGGRDGTGASPWSPTQVTAFTGRPSVTIITPDVTHGSDELVVEWDFHDPDGGEQSQWRVVLKNAQGVPVETRTDSGDARSRAMATRLPDGSSWTVEVAAWGSSGLPSSVVSRTFTVGWDTPPTPTGTLLWHRDDGYVTITVDVPAPGAGEEEVDHLQVYRAQGQGWVLVADGLLPGDTVTDWTPPVGTTVVYRVAAVSALPSTAWSADIPIETVCGWLFVNYGPSFGQVARFRSNVTATGSFTPTKVLHKLAGRKKPLVRMGEAEDETYSFRASLWDQHASTARQDQSGWDDIKDAARQEVVLVRAHGFREWVTITEPQWSGMYDVEQPVTIPLTVVDWHEETVSL